MSLVTEDGSGSATAESFCSVAAFDAFHTARGNATAVALSTPVKEQRLRKATETLQGWCVNRWPGCRQTLTQALDWPRYGAEYTDGQCIPASTVPPDVVKATAELAGSTDADDLQPDAARGGQVKSQTLGPLSKEFFPGAPAGKARPKVFAHLARLLGGYRLVRA